MTTTPAPQPSPETAPRTLHPLRVRDFRLLWMGAAVSLFGDQFYLVAMPWLVLQLTGSGLALGTVMMAAAIPRAVFMLMGGVVTDRFSPRRIMMTTACARALLVGIVGLLAYRNVIHLWQLYVLSVAFGLADAFVVPAHSALIPSIVTPEQLPAANSMIQGVVQASTIAGPAPAGLVVKRWGIAQAFFIDAVSFLFIIAALWRLPEKPRTSSGAQPAPQQNMRRSILEGLEYVWRDPPIRALMLLSTAVNFFIAGPLTIGIATLAKTRMGSATAFGTMLTVMSVGTLAGLVLAGVVPRPRRLGTALLVLTAVLGSAMSALGFLQQLLPVAGVLAGMGFASGFVQVHLVSWFQKRVDRALLGRVMSVLMFGAVGLIPVSYAAAGALVEVSPAAMFLTSGVLVLGVAAVTGIAGWLKPIE